MTAHRIADLTIEEFRVLIQETVRQTLNDMLTAQPELKSKLESSVATPATSTASKERLMDEPFGGIMRGLED